MKVTVMHVKSYCHINIEANAQHAMSNNSFVSDLLYLIMPWLIRNKQQRQQAAH